MYPDLFRGRPEIVIRMTVNGWLVYKSSPDMLNIDGPTESFVFVDANSLAGFIAKEAYKFEKERERRSPVDIQQNPETL